MKESIDSFLMNNEEIAKGIKNLAKNYYVSDFVKVQKTCKEYFETGKELGKNELYGCIYNERDDEFRLNIESPERRLTNEYLEFLHEILLDDNVFDKVFYIVAFHYLSLGKHMGYRLTTANNVPFPVESKREIFPLGKRNLKKLEEIREDSLFDVVRCLRESDILYYYNMYSEFGYHHHATKHFSLLAYLNDFDLMADRYDFEYKVGDAIDLFVFRYKAVFTKDKLGLYTSSDIKDNQEKLGKSIE